MRRLLESLRFDAPRQKLSALTESEQYFCDRNQISLLFQRNDKNLERIRRMKAAFWRVQQTLDAAGIEFVVLKGFANWERYWADPELRLQYDLDLYCPNNAIAARDALTKIGYQSIPSDGRSSMDHLPPLVQKTGWQWNGDFFDPEMPISVELHFRLWDEPTEGFAVPGLEDFWSRRVIQTLDGRPYLALDPVDALGYSCIHLLRHLLRGDVRAANVYELAFFLDTNAGNQDFWSRWRHVHGAGISFLLAKTWFGCRMNAVAQSEIDQLDTSVRKWFDRYAWSPAETLFRPNKDELWLHMCLLDSFQKRFEVLLRRIAPTKLPGPLDSVFIPDEQLTWRLRLSKRVQYTRYVAGRVFFHARALLPTLSRILRIRA